MPPPHPDDLARANALLSAGTATRFTVEADPLGPDLEADLSVYVQPGLNIPSGAVDATAQVFLHVAVELRPRLGAVTLLFMDAVRVVGDAATQHTAGATPPDGRHVILAVETTRRECWAGWHPTQLLYLTAAHEAVHCARAVERRASERARAGYEADPEEAEAWTESFDVIRALYPDASNALLAYAAVREPHWVRTAAVAWERDGRAAPAQSRYAGVLRLG